MKNLIRSFSNIFNPNSGSITKIVLLALGLAMGLTLIAKLYFENTYENFIPELERIFRIRPLYEKNGKLMDYYETPGAIAPAFKELSPSVELTTRYTRLYYDFFLKCVDDHSVYSASDGFYCQKSVIADSCFFKMFPRKMLAGNAENLLCTPHTTLISKSLADKMIDGRGLSYADVIGTVLAPQSYENKIVTIAGVYEDFPHNSDLENIEMVVPMISISDFMWDGTKNWVGNDRYLSYARLYQASAKSESIKAMNDFFEENIDPQVSEGTKIRYDMIPLAEYHTSFKNVRQTCNIIMILAVVVLIVSILNYILITLSALVKKAKNIATRKCYGASVKDIYKLVFSDTFVEILVSLLLAAFLLYAFEKPVERIVGSSLSALLSQQSIILLIGVVLIIFVLCALFPAAVYSKTPIATAFRNFKESNRRWKYVLLTLQFVASAFFVALLLVIILQYHFVLNKDTGYQYNNLIYTEIDGVDKEQREILKNEVSTLPFVESHTFSTMLPFEGAGGNNIRMPGNTNELFNIADMYYVDDGYFELMEIPIIAGENFNEANPSSQNKEIAVSRKFIEAMKPFADWGDDIVGRQIAITEHARFDDPYTICGVFEDFIVGNINDRDDRPAVLMYIKAEISEWDIVMARHIIKVNEVTAENMAAIKKIYKEILPDLEIDVLSYAEKYKATYDETRNTRDTIMTAGLVVFLITLIGLIGYCQDEMNRRRSELAIRKINGATLGELIKLFLINVLKMALFAVIAGCVAAYAVSGRLLEMFSERIDLTWWMYFISAVFTLVIIISVVISTTCKGANANPVESLKK